MVTLWIKADHIVGNWLSLLGIDFPCTSVLRGRCQYLVAKMLTVLSVTACLRYELTLQALVSSPIRLYACTCAVDPLAHCMITYSILFYSWCPDHQWTPCICNGQWNFVHETCVLRYWFDFIVVILCALFLTGKDGTPCHIYRTRGTEAFTINLSNASCKKS